jgi:hypothetical protein
MTLKEAITRSGKKKELESRFSRSLIWMHSTGRRGMTLDTAQVYSEILDIPLSELVCILRNTPMPSVSGDLMN